MSMFPELDALEQRKRKQAELWRRSGLNGFAADAEREADELAAATQAIEARLTHGLLVVWETALAHCEHNIAEISAAGKSEQYAHGLADAAESIRGMPPPDDLVSAILSPPPGGHIEPTESYALVVQGSSKGKGVVVLSPEEFQAVLAFLDQRRAAPQGGHIGARPLSDDERVQEFARCAGVPPSGGHRSEKG
jgi:hypothetical protein